VTATLLPRFDYPQLDWQWRDYSIRYTQLGPEDGAPIVLVHGFGASIGHWKKNIPDLVEAGYRVYALDLLGFGASEKPLVTYSLELWAELLTEFWQETVKRPAVWVGNSIGALLCLMVAADRPELTRGAVLLNCAGGISHRPDELPVLLRPIMMGFNWVVNSPILGPTIFELVRSRGQIRRALSQVYSNKAAIDDDLVDLLYQPSCDPNAQKVFASILTAPPGPTIGELLSKLDRPLLVLWGEADPWTPIDGAKPFQDLADTNHPVQVIGLPDTGHCPHDDRPELVNPPLVKWLADLG
jgi:pimeloyl-ACP methyl ester carboxylesterase